MLDCPFGNRPEKQSVGSGGVHLQGTRKIRTVTLF